MFGTLALVQIIAVLSIPVALVTVAFARVTVQKPIRTKDLVLATQFAVIPALLVLSVRGILPWWAGGGGIVAIASILPWWAGGGGIVAIALLAFVQGMNTD